MAKDLSISGLIQRQFGTKLVFEPDLEKLPERAEKNNFGTNYYGVDQFGREVFLPIELKYTDDNGDEQVINLYHAVLSLRSRNENIKTPLTERPGRFTELINGDDWMIRVEGFLISTTRDFPEDLFTQLVRLKKSRKEISMKNAITDIILIDKENNGSDKVVLDDLDFPATRGVINHKPFILSLVSETDFNLYEIE